MGLISTHGPGVADALHNVGEPTITSAANRIPHPRAQLGKPQSGSPRRCCRDQRRQEPCGRSPAVSGGGIAGGGAAEQTAVKAGGEVRQPLAERRDSRSTLQERNV